MFLGGSAALICLLSAVSGSDGGNYVSWSHPEGVRAQQSASSNTSQLIWLDNKKKKKNTNNVCGQRSPLVENNWKSSKKTCDATRLNLRLGRLGRLGLDGKQRIIWVTESNRHGCNESSQYDINSENEANSSMCREQCWCRGCKSSTHAKKSHRLAETVRF